jgi:hypothetical protein
MDTTYVAAVFSLRRRCLAVVVACAAAAFAACGSSATTNVTGPTASKCLVTVSNSASELPADGGSAKLTITSERECAWSAHTDASWIALSSASGQGPATIDYSVQANPSGTMRHGQVVVSDQSIDVAQQGAPCKFTLAPGSINVASSQSDVSFLLTSTPGCQWTAQSTVDWIGAAAPAAGMGNSSVRFTVSANGGGARVGIVQIGDAQATVIQQAAGSPSPPTSPAPPPSPPPEPPAPDCDFTVAPLSATVPATGGDVPIAVTGPSACAWAISSNADWISLKRSTMAGSATVVATVSANTGPARAGTLGIAGQTVTITQLAQPATPSCTYQLTPASVDITSTAQDVTVAIVAGDGCAWPLTSDVSWITIADGGSGIGIGTFRVTVAANSGGARTGIVHAATATLTVNQAAAPAPLCTYTITPASYDASRGADAVDVSVTAGATCAWTATTDAQWITIASGSAGLSNGTVHLGIAANDGPARVGTVTIAGQPFTVRQPAVCSYSINPTSATTGNRSDTINIDVTADSGCSWTASSPVTWVTISKGATGTGSGSVRLAVDANEGPDRSATITIANQPFLLTQKGK